MTHALRIFFIIATTHTAWLFSAEVSQRIVERLSFVAKIADFTKTPDSVASIIVSYMCNRWCTEKISGDVPCVLSTLAIGMTYLGDTYCAAFTDPRNVLREEAYRGKVAQLRLFSFPSDTNLFMAYNGNFVFNQDSSSEGVITSLNQSTLAATPIIKTKEHIVAFGSCGSYLLYSHRNTLIMGVDQGTSVPVALGQQRSSEVQKSNERLDREDVIGFISNVAHNEFISCSRNALYHWSLTPAGLKLKTRTKVADYILDPDVHCVLSDTSILVSARHTDVHKSNRPHILRYKLPELLLQPADEFAFNREIESGVIAGRYTILGTNAQGGNTFALLYCFAQYDNFMRIYDVRGAIKPIEQSSSIKKKPFYYNQFFD